MHRRAAALWVVLAVTSIGCATPIQFSPPSAELRQQLGVVRISYRQGFDRPTIETAVEGKGQGAASGAGDGALAVMRFGHGMCVSTIQDGLPVSLISPAHILACAGWEALGVALTPLGAAVGETVGAIRSRSAEEALSAQRSLQFAVADAEPTETLIALIEEKSQQQGMAVHADRTQPFLPPADYPLLCKGGIDTALLVTVVIFDVLMEGKFNPALAVLTEVTGTLIRTRDGMTVYERSWIYLGEERHYFDLAEEDGDNLRVEIRQSLEQLAERIVSDLFVSTDIEVGRGPVRGEAVAVRGEVVTFDAWQHSDYEVAE
jgi:hypothetical protein